MFKPNCRHLFQLDSFVCVLRYAKHYKIAFDGLFICNGILKTYLKPNHAVEPVFMSHVHIYVCKVKALPTLGLTCRFV